MSTGRTAIAHLGRSMILVTLTAIVLCVGNQSAGAYEHRKSTPSFGVQFGYGRIISGETFFVKSYPLVDGRVISQDFDLADTHSKWGPSVHLGIRFVLDRNHALGFGFDDLRYQREDGYTSDQREVIPKWAKFTTFHADYYLYFQRRKQISYYVGPFIGMQQRELRFKGSEVQVQEYKFLYGSSVGVEYFLGRTFSIDAGGRIFALRGGSGTNVVMQPVLGVHLYVI